MMFLVLSVLLATAAAFPQREPVEEDVFVPLEAVPRVKLYKEPIPIVSMRSDVSHDGNFHYSYESADGTKAEQVGEVRDFGEDKKGSVASGSYEFIGDDGQLYKVEYTADENGFQARGAHLPVAPPVPEAIARALAYIAAHPPPVEEYPTKVIAN
ncbi:hypothetical protein J437_LFUL005842 [Ladona fulva]|uniref:Uncharacterized protein n=1 Tax=Ladona fulva TaxID=123851 RepID=A0A8K0KEF3_LADFU|nr:hypothetical protein J437_LFUL005842 [Ladona fulva]